MKTEQNPENLKNLKNYINQKTHYTTVITNIDKRIIKILQDDARTSITDIAKKVGLSRNAVKYRIKMLEREGYIKKYNTVIEPEKFGKKLMILFNFDVELQKLKQTVTELKKYNSLTKIYIAASNPSIVAFGFFKDQNELNDFLMKELAQLPIKGYRITTILDKIKESNCII